MEKLLLIPRKPIIHIDMDDTIYDYSGAIEKGHQELINPNTGEPFNAIQKQFPQAREGFFLGLEPITDAIPVVSKLRDDIRIQTFICSAPSLENLHSYSEKPACIGRDFGAEMVKNLLLAYNKGNPIFGDILIDDHSSGRGQEHFMGEIIKIGTDKYPDWKTIDQYLEQRIPQLIQEIEAEITFFRKMSKLVMPGLLEQ